MKKTIERVKELLIEMPHLRDDDKRLTVKIWLKEMTNRDSINLFLLDYIDNTLTSESTIRRARRKVQELHPELRGKKWHERHAQQEQVKKELGYEN